MTSRHPFTVAQWQQLEHQALFFKFMVSGLPIPPDLIFSIKGRSSTQRPHQIGWSCFQLGLSQTNANIDPEPRRCRRTDGKKWRCSRHTTGDSKYCERHMHRGKNRSSRKHPDTKPLQTYITSSLKESAYVNSNLSSVTTEMSCQHHHLNSCKDSTFLGIEKSSVGAEKGGRIMQYHQFIEESPAPGKRKDSWLKLVI